MAAVTVISVVLLILFTLDLTVGQVGVCYGRVGNNLSSPSQVVELYKQNNITRMRLYRPDDSILGALSGSNIEVMLGVPNPELQNLAASQANADEWVKNNVRDYPNVRFRYIAIGNEVSPSNDLSPFVLPALQNVYNAVSAARLGNQIRVSTAIDTSVLGNSFPPSAGKFGYDTTSYLNPIIEFLVNTSAPLFVNIYPFFSYIVNENQIDLQYVLLQPNYKGVVMPGGKLYRNLFHAMLDAVYAALEKSGGSSVEIVVSESGWPSAGAGEATTVENARIYNNNLIALLKNGTPERPGRPIETYIYSVFDENRKLGYEYERYFGMFMPNGEPKYAINFGIGKHNSIRMSETMTCVFAK